jgi:hypothetical protein
MQIPGARPVTTSPSSLVEMGIVTSVSSQGTVLPRINWSGGTIEMVVVMLHFEPAHPVSSVTTASGQNVTMKRSGSSNFLSFTLALKIAADVIVLRA